MTDDTYYLVLGGPRTSHEGAGPGIDGGVAMSLADITWRLRGACHGLDPSIFFPEDDDEAEGLSLADHPEYGLAAGVYTADLGRGLRAMRAP